MAQKEKATMAKKNTSADPPYEPLDPDVSKALHEFHEQIVADATVNGEETE